MEGAKMNINEGVCKAVPAKAEIPWKPHRFGFLIMSSFNTFAPQKNPLIIISNGRKQNIYHDQA
jgi:hypothetical protein